MPVTRCTSARQAALACFTLLSLLAACGGADDPPAAPAPAPQSPPAPPSPGGTRVAGVFQGPLGAAVVLQNNAGDDLPLTIPSAGATLRYDELAFNFNQLLADGSAYAVSLKTAPVDHSCSVYQGANGTLPTESTPLRVGCEITDDLVSRSTDDAVLGTFFDSFAPSIGGADVPVGSTATAHGEGRYVAFVSGAPGMGGATGSNRQVYWRDRLTGETVLVSANAAGQQGNGQSQAPVVSADGQTVAFESFATNLDGADTNGARDVFVWSAARRGLGAVRVSVGAGGAQGNSHSWEPTLSGDGSLVAFTTNASNLTGGASGPNVVLRNLATGVNTLVTTDATGAGVGGSSPMLSESGARLAFYSFSSKITEGDTNDLWDVFVYDSATGAKRRVSLRDGGGERDVGTESRSRGVWPSISGDGRYVAYATTSTNVVAGDTNGLQDVFVVEVDTGRVVRASVSDAGVQGDGDSPLGQGERPALSYDGQWVAFSTRASNLGVPINNVVMRQWATGQTHRVSDLAISTVGAPVMSRKGAYVAFGAGMPRDSRFASTGLFAHYTGVARAFAWQD
ncbi:periplasmic component of the Tol biopolymer transport system [Burkholderiales bacterium JOSHI_001]|nr:periplasmic component of the Tol biopolymer transport system [Burkholderiales bacterium JOSHI_001]